MEDGCCINVIQQPFHSPWDFPHLEIAPILLDILELLRGTIVVGRGRVHGLQVFLVKKGDRSRRRRPISDQ
jgi:hypothetical protein